MRLIKIALATAILMISVITAYKIYKAETVAVALPNMKVVASGFVSSTN